MSRIEDNKEDLVGKDVAWDNGEQSPKRKRGRLQT